MVKFISPSGLETWLKSQDEYYTKYVAKNRPPKILQTGPMSVGGAFDSYVKSDLHTRLYGPVETARKGLDFDTLFNKAIETHNLDFALKAGAEVYRQYIASGAYARLLRQLESAKNVQFEYTLDGREITVNTDVPYETTAVIMLGKPDLSFLTKQDVFVVSDWKVNGYCSNSGASPLPGYVLSHKTKNIHKDAHPGFHGDVEYNMINSLEDGKPDWARQLSVYSWLHNAPFAGEFIVQIEQCTFRSGVGHFVTHSNMISPEFQRKTLEQFQKVWDRVHGGWFFRELTRPESDARCERLENMAIAYQGPDQEKNEWLRSIRGK